MNDAENPRRVAAGRDQSMWNRSIKVEAVSRSEPDDLLAIGHLHLSREHMQKTLSIMTLWRPTAARDRDFEDLRLHRPAPPTFRQRMGVHARAAVSARDNPAVPGPINHEPRRRQEPGDKIFHPAVKHLGQPHQALKGRRQKSVFDLRQPTDRELGL